MFSFLRKLHRHRKTKSHSGQNFRLAVRIVNLYKYLQENKREYTLSKQILRCGTSVGANAEEAIGGYTLYENDFDEVELIKEQQSTTFLSDGIVLESTQREFNGAVVREASDTNNHFQIRKSPDTEIALRELYSGQILPFFSLLNE